MGTDLVSSKVRSCLVGCTHKRVKDVVSVSDPVIVPPSPELLKTLNLGG